MSIRQWRTALVALIIIFLLLLPQTFLSPTIFAPYSSASSTSSGSNQYQDRAISLDSSQSRVTLGLLNYFTGGQQSVAAYEGAINKYFLPLNVRQVLLDIGWENYPVGNIPNETWISNWLSASDTLGIRNLFYLGQFTTSGIGSPWIMSLIQSDPSTQTYYSNGQPANYISFDNPQVAKAVETDLSILYSYYGNHTSWVGIGTGSTQDNPYYASGGSLPPLGYSNSTVQQFVNSAFFARDLNQTGYLPSGAVDPLWASYKGIGNSISLSSGNYVNPTTFHLYGNQSYAQMLAMRFYIPQSEQSIQLQWYGSIVGSPSDLKTLIYADRGGTFSASQTPISVENESSSGVSQKAGWTGPIQYTGPFSPGFYWVVFEASSTNDSNYYNMYTENQATTNSSAVSIYSFSNFSLGGPQSSAGSSILWVKDANGTSLSIYPLLSTATSTSLSQSFVAGRSFSFNTVFLYIGPKNFGTDVATVSVVDETKGGQTVAQGTFTQNSIHGLTGWVPILLGNSVTTTAGNTYLIQISSQGGVNSWYRVIQSIVSNPPSAGFQNQGQYWLFELGLLGFSQSHFDYSLLNAGPNVVKQNSSLAFQFVPSSTESLQAVDLMMMSKSPGSSYYTSGSLTVSVWTSSPYFTSPGTKILQSVTVPAVAIPENGMFSVPGFSLQVNRGTAYWVVLSSSDPTGYTLAQFGNPYYSPVRLSLNGGSTWIDPSIGTADIGYAVVLSNEILGNTVNGIATVSLASSATIFAEPLSVTSATDLSGLLIGPISLAKTQSPSDQLTVSVQTDNGRGEPSGIPLASGTIGVENITSSSLAYAGFTSIAKLLPGQKYWMVIQPQGGSYYLQPDSYSSPPSDLAQGYVPLLSNNNGANWISISGSSSETDVLSYALVIPLTSHPTYNTSGIYSLLLDQHSASTQSGLLRGWNAYVQVSQASTYNSILSYFRSLTGKSLIFSAGIDPNVVDQLGYGSVVGTGSSPENCSDMGQLLLNNAPIENIQYVGVSNSTNVLSCNSPDVNHLAQELNYLLYADHNNGLASNSKILVVGDNSGRTIATYLSNAYPVNYVTLGSDPTLSLPSGLSSYSTVVWLSSSDSGDYSAALQNYVDSGGTLVVVGASSSKSSLVPSWLYPFIGFSPPAVSGSSSKVPSDLQHLFYSMTANTPYNQTLTFNALNGSTTVASAAGLTLAENILNSTDGGRVLFMQLQGQNVTNSPQISNEFVVLSNIIAQSLKRVGASPFFYGANTAVSGNSGVVYAITGGSGTPLLVWLSNPSGSDAVVNLELNGSFYGLDTSWSLINMTDVTVSSGNGTFISINTTVPAQSWRPYYVVQNVSKPGVMYSNALVQRQLAYPNQALYSLDGVRNQSILTAIKSLHAIQNVSLDDKLNLTQVSSAASLLGQNDQGWYYDNASDTLFVSYTSSGNNSVRVFYSVNHTTTHESTLFLYPSLLQFTVAFLVVAGASTSAYVYMQFKRRKNQK